MKAIHFMSVAALSTSSVFAAGYDPAPLKLTDGFNVVPQVLGSVRYDDNIYNLEKDTIGSSIYILQPSIKFGTDDGINRYGGVYELTSATYSRSSDDNYLDHKLKLLAHTEYTSRHRTDFQLGFANLHENRGTGKTEGLVQGNNAGIDEPLKYNELNARGYYQFGGLTAMMRIGGGVEYTDRTYQNFRDGSAKYNTKSDDVNHLKFFGDADYQVGRVTYLTFDLMSTDITYDHAKTEGDNKDNVDSRAMLGFKWEGLGKTTGIIKAGYQYKTFDNDNRKNFSGSTVDLGVVWEPLKRDSFTVHLSHEAKDSDRVGDYIEVLGGSLGWVHDWTEKFDSSLQFVYQNENYINDPRKDDTMATKLDFNYDFARWLKGTAGYEYTTKDSNAKNISYDKNSVYIGVEVAL